jgi:hypothetical protein
MMVALSSTTQHTTWALWTVALGRKNYLFAGSDATGERAVAIYKTCPAPPS